MPITSTQKPQAFMRDLVDHLQKRMPSTASGLNTFRQAFDENGMPEVFISHNGVETAGNPVVYIRILQISAVSPDIFGNPLLAYTPLQMQIAWELGAAGNETEPATSDLLNVFFESTKTGIQQVYFEIAHGTAVTEAAVNAATPVASLDELYWPTKNP